jgi:microcystin degradation protein MlrC
MQKKIAIIELQQETNSFSPVLTTLEDFKAGALGYGAEEVMVFSKIHNKKQIAGFLGAVSKFGNNQITVIPIITAWATSGGPLEFNLYHGFKQYIMESLRQLTDLSGIFLSMHGAMGVEGMQDPESDILREIRQIVGNHVPIGVAFDLHANVTQEIVNLSTFITGYRTNPHRDHYQVGSGPENID